MRLIKASNLLELTFPRSALICASAAVLGVLFSGSRELIQIFFAGATFYLISALFFSLDSLIDIDIDKVSRPHRPLPSGRVNYTQARRLVLALIFACAVIMATYAAFTTNYLPLTLALACLVLMTLYSIPPIRLSDIPLLSNGVVASLFTVFPTLTGWTTFRPIREAPLTLIAAIFLLAWGDMEDFVDIDGDKSRGIKTLPIVTGERKAGVILTTLCILSILIGLLDLWTTRRIYWLFSLPLQLAVFAFTATLMGHPTREQIRVRHSSCEVLVFATGVTLAIGYMLMG